MKIQYHFLLFCIIVFFVLNHTSASPGHKDSLRTLLGKPTNQEHKSQLLSQIAAQYVAEKNPDSALHYYHAAYKFMQDTTTKQAENLFNETGLIHYYQGNFTSALNYFKKSLYIAQHNNDSNAIGRRLSNIAVIYDHIGDYVQAFKYNQEALSIFENLSSKRGMAFINNNLGVLSEEMGNYENALNYYHKALQLKYEINDTLGMGSSLNNIGVVYENYLSRYDSSIVYYQKALDVFRKVDNKSGIATSLGNIGLVFWIKQQPDSAIYFSEKALEIRQNLNDVEGISSSLLNLGRAWFDNGEFNKAESYYRQSLEISRKISSRKRISEVYEALALLFHKTEDNSRAYLYHLKYAQLKDSILNEENSKQIAELKTRYELEKKDEKLTELSLKNQIQKQSIIRYNYLLGAIFFIAVLITAIAILMIRQRRMKVAQHTAELQQKLLRSQMNPHFIFNTLFSIQTYMQEKNTTAASQFLSRFAKLMRHILENSNHDFVSLQDEMDFLDEYLKTQQLRYGGTFDYSIRITNLIEDPEDLLIPPMLTQPFVENAIEHGFRNINRPGEIIVNFSISNKKLHIQIMDNGEGIGKSKSKQGSDKKHKSTGIDNTLKRIKILCDKHKCKQEFTITDMSQETPKNTGTIVTFAIPLIFNE